MNINREQITIIVVVGAVLLLVGAGALLYGLSQGGTIPGFGAEPTPAPITEAIVIPDIKITPPGSIEEIAKEIRAEYPELADLLENPELGSAYKEF